MYFCIIQGWCYIVFISNVFQLKINKLLAHLVKRSDVITFYGRGMFKKRRIGLKLRIFYKQKGIRMIFCTVFTSRFHHKQKYTYKNSCTSENNFSVGRAHSLV